LKGHFRKRGKKWSFTVDIGRTPESKTEDMRSEEDDTGEIYSGLL